MREKIFDDLAKELEDAEEKYAPRFYSLNEAIGTVFMEFLELSLEVKQHGDPERVKAEAIQVAAMCCKLIEYLDSKHE